MQAMDIDNQVQLKDALAKQQFEWQIRANRGLVCGVSPWEHHPVFYVKIDEELKKNGVTWFFAIYGNVNVVGGDDDWHWDLTVEVMKNPYGKDHRTWEFDLKSWSDIKQQLLFWPGTKAHFSQLTTLLFTDVMNQLAEKELTLDHEPVRAKIAQMYAQGFARIR